MIDELAMGQMIHLSAAEVVNITDSEFIIYKKSSVEKCVDTLESWPINNTTTESSLTESYTYTTETETSIENPLDWTASMPFVIGVGIQNLNNTYYISAILQVFVHLAAFAHWLMGESKHSELCECSNSLSCTNSLY